MNSSIGLFDSGLGGLTVMREVIRLLPSENLIYLADTARLPYGNKSPQTILECALDNAAFLIEKNIKLLIVSCHTASAHALETLQKTLPIPVIGMIQPTLDLLHGVSRLAVLATKSTVESEIYQRRIRERHPQIQIYAKACPLFVPLIEEGFHNHPAASLVATSYLEPLQGQIDAALLACTHYPLLTPLLEKILGPKVRLIEPAAACAAQARAELMKRNLLNFETKNPRREFYVSNDPEKFHRFGKTFFELEMQSVQLKKNKNL